MYSRGILQSCEVESWTNLAICYLLPLRFAWVLLGSHEISLRILVTSRSIICVAIGRHPTPLVPLPKHDQTRYVCCDVRRYSWSWSRAICWSPVTTSRQIITLVIINNQLWAFWVRKEEMSPCSAEYHGSDGPPLIHAKAYPSTIRTTTHQWSTSGFRASLDWL